MAWNRNTGGRNQGPWGQQPGGNGSGPRGSGPREQPPDLDDILKRSQDRIRRAFPPGFGGSAMAILLLAGLIVVWMLSGIYVVSPTQQGVILRFGKYARVEPNGMHWHIPWPVEQVYLPEVTRVFPVNIGGASDTSDSAEDLMLTRDRNFLTVNFTVQYQIKDAKEYLFDVNNPAHAVVDVSKAAMREVVGRNDFDSLQTEQRTAAEQQAKNIIQQTLDTYHAGIRIVEVNIQRVDPPDEALKAARDVESARQDQQTAQNNAEAYKNQVIPQAKGKAQRIIQDAEAYKQSVIAEAEGQSARFDAIYEQYKKAPDVTRRRMYLETMEDILAGMNKVIVDQKGGVVPYLPLPQLHPNTAKTDGGN